MRQGVLVCGNMVRLLALTEDVPGESMKRRRLFSHRAGKVGAQMKATLYFSLLLFVIMMTGQPSSVGRCYTFFAAQDRSPMSEMSASIEIPNRALFKASEVCELVKVQPYVLRSWEAEFPHLGVTKSANAPAFPGNGNIVYAASAAQAIRWK